MTRALLSDTARARYNESLCPSNRAPVGAYVFVMSFGAFSAVFAMAGFVALLYEDRDLMIGHCCVGALVVLIWWAIFAALVAGRSAAVRDIEGEACYEILRYLPATFFKASGSGSSSSARDSL